MSAVQACAILHTGLCRHCTLGLLASTICQHALLACKHCRLQAVWCRAVAWSGYQPDLCVLCCAVLSMQGLGFCVQTCAGPLCLPQGWETLSALHPCSPLSTVRLHFYVCSLLTGGGMQVKKEGFKPPFTAGYAGCAPAAAAACLPLLHESLRLWLPVVASSTSSVVFGAAGAA